MIRERLLEDHQDVVDQAAARRLALTSAGNPELVELVRQHFQFVWRLLRRLGLPQPDADDAAQQVFLVACARAADIRPGSERTFLYGCALRHAAKWRASKKTSSRAEDFEREEPESQVPDAEALLDQRRAREILDSLLDSMDGDLRLVFVLYEFEELSTQEIADLLAIARGTVASRLRRAREDFERRVQRHERRSDFGRIKHE